MEADIQFSGDDYRKFQDFLERRCGIVLGEHKQYLVVSRLGTIFKNLEISTLSQLIDRMSSVSGGQLSEKVVDCMTTNETLWFRDAHPFEYFAKTIIPELKRQGSARIWCAACSSGQEPYSLSMAMKEQQAMNDDIRIIATDISRSILDKAREGAYDSMSLGRGLSSARLEEHFESSGGGLYTVKPEIRRKIDFRPINLIESYTALGKFDVIFCRNVLIYFSSDLKHDILTRMHAMLKPNGYLFLGASESMGELSDLYRMDHYSPGIVYRAI